VPSGEKEVLAQLKIETAEGRKAVADSAAGKKYWCAFRQTLIFHRDAQRADWTSAAVQEIERRPDWGTRL